MTTRQIVTAPVKLPHNKYLLKAVEAELPQYQDALNREQQADELLRDLAPVAPVPAALEVSSAWLDAVRAREIAVAEYEARRRILLQLKTKAAANSSGILESGWNRLLSALHLDLMAILDVAESIEPKLGGASTAQQAIAADAGTPWKQLTGLADDYDTVRSAQEFVALRLPRTYLISSRPALGGEDHASDLYLRGLDSLWPSWRNPNAGPQKIKISGPPDRLEPWPTDATERLLWLVRNRSTAQPWVPSTFDLDRLWRERREPAHQPTNLDDATHDQPEDEPYKALLAGAAFHENQRRAALNEPKRGSSYGRQAPADFNAAARAAAFAEVRSTK